MAGVTNLKLSDKDYERLYKEQSEKLSLIEGVVKFTVAEQIKILQQENSVLQQENSELRGQISNFDKWREDLIKNKNAEIEAIKKTQDSVVKGQTTRRQNVEDDYYRLKNTSESTIKNKDKEIERLGTVINDLEKKIIENEALLRSREEEINRLISIESKIDTIQKYLTDNLSEIKEMINNGSSKEEILDTIEETEETLNGNGRLDDLDRDIKMAKDLANGESKSAVAKKYLGHRSQPMAALSKKMKADRFVGLIEYFKDNTKEVPEAYKELI